MKVATLKALLGLPTSDQNALKDVNVFGNLSPKAKRLTVVANRDKYFKTADRIAQYKLRWERLLMPVTWGPRKILQVRGQEMNDELWRKLTATRPTRT